MQYRYGRSIVSRTERRRADTNDERSGMRASGTLRTIRSDNLTSSEYGPDKLSQILFKVEIHPGKNFNHWKTSLENE